MDRYLGALMINCSYQLPVAMHLFELIRTIKKMTFKFFKCAVNGPHRVKFLPVIELSGCFCPHLLMSFARLGGCFIGLPLTIMDFCCRVLGSWNLPNLPNLLKAGLHSQHCLPPVLRLSPGLAISAF